MMNAQKCCLASACLACLCVCRHSSSLFYIRVGLMMTTTMVDDHGAVSEVNHHESHDDDHHHPPHDHDDCKMTMTIVDLSDFFLKQEL